MSVVMPCTVDHLVVGAASLDAGCTFVADLLGELPLPGGVHLQLGTHNAVLSLGGSVYLEVIAIDPDGKTPVFPRWFSLDSDQTRADLEVSPRLLTWVVRTPVITSLKQLDAYAACKVRPMSRAHLRWEFAFTPDGQCLAGGLLPQVIQWQGSAHPVDVLPPGNCWFIGLHGESLDAAQINLALQQMDLDDSLQCAESDIESFWALIDTPRGSVRL